jgi:hypothetical protein
MMKTEEQLKDILKYVNFEIEAEKAKKNDEYLKKLIDKKMFIMFILGVEP